MKKSLLSSEWLLVGSLIAIILSLLFISQVNAYRASSILSATLEEAKEELVLVTIEGAVAKPGEYWLPSGTTVAQALRKARLKPFADIQALPLKQIIEEPLHLRVEEFTEVVVSVRGAVEKPLDLTLPTGTRVCDLKSKIILTRDADKSFFRRRKLLKNGDIIEVPKKDVE